MSDEAANLAGGRSISLPFSKAMEISLRSLKIRFGRSLLSWVIRPFSYHLMSKYIRNKDFFDQR